MTRVNVQLAGAAAAGLTLVGVFVGLTGHPVAQQLTYDLGALGFFALLAIGLGRHIDRRSWVWRSLFAGVACELAGDIVAGAPAFPSPGLFAHGFYLAGFPFFIAGLVGSMRPRRLIDESTLPQLLDSAIVFVSGFAVLFFAWLDGSFRFPGDSFGHRFLMVTYPVLDWLVLALLLRFVFTPGRWPLALRLLVAAVGLMFVSDLASPGEFIRTGATVHLEVGVASLLSYVVWALAGLHPSVAEIDGLSPRSEDRASVFHRRRLALLLVCAVVPGSLLLATHGKADDGTADTAALMLVVAGVPLLTVARLADMFRSLRRSVEAADQARGDLEAVIDASPIPICVTDHEASVLIWNEAAEGVSGYSAAEVVGQPPPIVPADDPERVASLYQAALAGTVQRGVEIKLLDRQERPLDIRFSTAPLEAGRRGVVVLFEDVSEQRQSAEKIEFLASRDPLTGLPNRRTFSGELDRAVARAARGGHSTLVLCDIDNFKLINDTGGHPIGDRFLVEIANRLQSQLRPTDALARLSGDEFAILLGDTTAAEATRAIERLLESIRSYRVESRAGVLDVTVSIGTYELRDGESADRALRRADDALYEAKEHGKDQQRCWRPDSVAVLSASRGWSTRIKDALHDDRVEAFLQPIVSLPSEKVSFYEALCRLRRPASTSSRTPSSATPSGWG
jgi:diguanylate cyclase (GGDEF)-like protein/PAS domain S-box-containing protein